MFWKQIQVPVCCILYYRCLQGEQFYHTESLHPPNVFCHNSYARHMTKGTSHRRQIQYNIPLSEQFITDFMLRSNRVLTPKKLSLDKEHAQLYAKCKFIYLNKSFISIYNMRI